MPKGLPTLEELKRDKIKMYERDFCFTLSSKELSLINSASNERELDVRGRQIISNHFED